MNPWIKTAVTLVALGAGSVLGASVMSMPASVPLLMLKNALVSRTMLGS